MPQPSDRARRIVVGVAALALLLLTISPSTTFAADPAPEVPSQGAAGSQQEGMLLWIAGDYGKAIESMKKLYVDFQNEQRGRSAYFHIANKLENMAIIEADSIPRAREILTAARDYYHGAAYKTPGQGKVALDRSVEGYERLTLKLAQLDAIEANPADFRAARGALTKMDADLTIVNYLKSRLGTNPADDAEITFLILIHWIQYLEGIYQRLVEIHSQFETTRPEFFEFGNGKYAPIAMASSAEATAFAHDAIERYPRSQWILEFHVYAGDAHRYSALARIATRDGLIRKGDQGGAGKLAREIVRETAAGANQNKIIQFKAGTFALVAAAMQVPSGTAPPELAGLLRYGKMASQRAQEMSEMTGTTTTQ